MPGGLVDGEVTSVEGRITSTRTVRERLVLRTAAVVDGDIRVG